jgi:pectinesterase
MVQTLYVNKNAHGENVFGAVTEALVAAGETGDTPVEIRIAPGIYHEKIEIRRGNLALIGEGHAPSDVVLSYDDFAFDEMPDGSRRGTFRSYSVFLDASDVRVSNLSIENVSGDERTHGQAIALYAEGDRLYFENVRLLSRQDTLFTGPLPPKEIQPGGFVGPKQFAPRINGRQYYKDCYICGNVDFIFGSATAVFENCELESLSRSGAPGDIQGYVCAPSTPEGQDYGYLFRNCRFTSKDCAPGSCYLMRPWREFAKAVFAHCKIGPHIHPDGFHDWNKPTSHKTALFASYENRAVDSFGNDFESFHPKADFSTELTDAQADFYMNVKEIFS